jgi:hypothetical protein
MSGGVHRDALSVVVNLRHCRQTRGCTKASNQVIVKVPLSALHNISFPEVRNVLNAYLPN